MEKNFLSQDGCARVGHDETSVGTRSIIADTSFETDEPFVGKESTRSPSPMVFVARRLSDMLATPVLTRPPPSRTISSLTPQDGYCSGSEAEFDEDSVQGNCNAINNSENCESSQQSPFVESRARTHSINSIDEYDGRGFHVDGKDLVPMSQEEEEEDAESIEAKNRRPKRIQRLNCLHEDSIKNMKHQTIRGLQYIKKQSQKKSRRSHRSSTNNMKNGKRNKTSKKIPVSADFCLNGKPRRKMNQGYCISSSANDDVLSDMSDHDPQDENVRYGRQILSAPFAHHIPRAVEVVTRSVKRCVSNGYGQVQQIIESNLSNESTSTSGLDVAVNYESIVSDLDMSSPSCRDVSEVTIERAVNDLTLERHSSNILDDRDGASPEIQQTFSDFNKNMTRVYIDEDSTNINDSANEECTSSVNAASSASSRSGRLIQPRFSKPSALSQPEVDKPSISVRQIAKDIDLQNELESSFAAGQQGPKTPRIIGRRTLSQVKKPPPQCLFKKFQPPEKNDTLKVVFLSAPHSDEAKTSIVHGLSTDNQKRKLSKESTVDVNIHMWDPDGGCTGDLLMLGFGAQKPRFRLFDLKGGSLESGSHHSTQFLFYSPNSLYIIVWDMSVHELNSESHLSNDDDCEGDFFELERIREREEKAINRDITENVLYWVDTIDELNFPGCAVMPIVLSSRYVERNEMERRCGILKNRLASYNQHMNIVFGSKGQIPIVSIHEESGLEELRRSILNISSHDISSDRGIFRDHFQTLSPTILRTREVVIGLRSRKCKAVRFSDVYKEISNRPPSTSNFSRDLVREALVFLSSIGEVIYYGDQITECARPELLKEYIVMDPKWLSFAIASVLNQRKINEVRDRNFDMTSPTLKCLEGLYISEAEAIQIWEDNALIRSIGDYDLFYFLKALCEHCGIFVPISINTIDRSPSYLLPRVQKEPKDAGPWTFKSDNRYKSVLCHSWLIKEILPVTFMDQICAAVLNELTTLGKQDQHDSRVCGGVPIVSVEQILSYKQAVFAKVIEKVPSCDENDHLIYSITELYVRLTRVDSLNCVGSMDMRDTDYKLIVCGKGFVGNGCEKIWTLGYGPILKCVESVVREFTKGSILKQIACPGCLLDTSPEDACMWKEEFVQLHVEDELIMCSNPINVHRISSQSLLGEMARFHDDSSIATGFTAYSATSYCTTMTCRTYDTCDKAPWRKVPDILPSVVLVGLWDRNNGIIRSVGSGFIADQTRGLIVTAGHIFYNLGDSEEDVKEVGKAYFGIPKACAVVGVYDKGTSTALFQYRANIVRHDLGKADACILHLKEKFQKPIAPIGDRLPHPQLTTIDFNVKAENLKRLNFTDTVELESNVRVLGYNQEGEGLLLQGEHIDCSPCFGEGLVLKKIVNLPVNTLKERKDSRLYFTPQSEIVIKCRTKCGHSGGPCVNNKGQVIGIMSRSDPVDEERNYLAPSGLIYSLLGKAILEVDRLTLELNRLKKRKPLRRVGRVRKETRSHLPSS